MLSQKEYEDALWKSKNIPKSITGQAQKNLQQVYRKKLMEHYYASHYPPFEPSPYELIFINYRTTEETLIQLIKIIKSSTVFIIDTESVGVYKKPNKPALIQVQIVTRELNSYILLIEVHHLPRSHVPTFLLIQQLFELLFQTKNTIYVWGEIDELTKFTEFNLFSYDQIYLSNNINLQGKFKLYWYKHHPHIQTSTTNNQRCICEGCIGIQENNPWSIQAATAYELHKWLDKRHTRSPFDIGLDPKLIKLNSSELQYRQLITSYAANDCDAMYQLLISMNLIKQQSSQSLTIEEQTNNNLELMLFDINEQNKQELIDEQQDKITSSTTTHYEFQIPSFNDNEPIESSTHSDEYMSDNNNEQQLQQTSPVEHNPIHIKSQQHTQQLTKEERHKIHNRTCTLKQRKRYYQREIQRRNIDKRFKIRNIKKILRQHRILFTAVNFSTSPTTHERTLHVGIKDISKLKTYEVQIKNLFTTEHYTQVTYKEQQVHRREDNYCRCREHCHCHRRATNR
ncbi:unnamed protein product [Rotaria sordida]|uniref:3'-5' exonuclease domain-containing protein n=1 Tax=Rotaria sordida TaxID=392033 RepID=A0A819U1T1_9BILA|nr:unnamed protein product [Rotaria sordida]CAF1241957.1 unnamed protein product [Rotaria sordida]CAF1265895.1 unnamed protein product [Rotaria sordida]CAF4001523.1 unnamed protein product [Rotaria sordida]CAF4086992.1 unnamed protein product [Rotaria sordida]